MLQRQIDNPLETHRLNQNPWATDSVINGRMTWLLDPRTVEVLAPLQIITNHSHHFTLYSNHVNSALTAEMSIIDPIVCWGFLLGGLIEIFEESGSEFSIPVRKWRRKISSQSSGWRWNKCKQPEIC